MASFFDSEYGPQTRRGYPARDPNLTLGGIPRSEVQRERTLSMLGGRTKRDEYVDAFRLRTRMRRGEMNYQWEKRMPEDERLQMALIERRYRASRYWEASRPQRIDPRYPDPVYGDQRMVMSASYPRHRADYDRLKRSQRTYAREHLEDRRKSRWREFFGGK